MKKQGLVSRIKPLAMALGSLAVLSGCDATMGGHVQRPIQPDRTRIIQQQGQEPVIIQEYDHRRSNSGMNKYQALSLYNMMYRQRHGKYPPMALQLMFLNGFN